MRQTSSRGGPHVARRYYGRKTAADKKTATKQRGSRSREQRFARRRRNAILALLVGILLTAVTVWYLDRANEILPGIRVGEVSVGGMTQGQAREAVERHAAEVFDEIRFGDGVSSVSGESLGVKVDAASAAEEAYAIGRQGWMGERVLEIVRAYLGGIQVDPNVEYEEAAARDAVVNVAHKFYEKPQDATFRVTDGHVEVQPGRDGRVLDREGTLANLDLALANLSNEVPLAEGPSPEPEVSAQEVEKLRPTKVIGKYQTDFRWDSNPNRRANMRLAAGAINNTLLAPGEVFSVTEQTESLHYSKAKTFSDGGIGYENGGGLCQVSSTLYMAAQYAGLDIVERHPHFAVLPYIKPGFDATVWFGEPGNGWGAMDMRFKNNTDAYILVREWVDEKGFLNAEIQGQPTGKKVEMRTKKVWERPQVGIKWATYKKVTDEDGKVLFDGLIYDYIYGYNPPVPEDMPHYDASAPRVAGWPDPTNTTGWASPH